MASVSNSSLDTMVSTIVGSPSNATSKSAKSSGSSSKKKSTSLPAETVDYLKSWMMSPEHIAHPYPTEQEKAQIMSDTGIELKQLTNWFVNNRKRYWKPRVEARLQQQVQLPMAPTGSPLKRRASGQQLAPIDVVDRAILTPSVTTVLTSKPTEEQFKAVARVSLPGASTYLRNAAQAVVSDASCSASYASDTGSVFSSSTDDDLMILDTHASDEIMDGAVSRTETVDVHILRPLNGIKPTIADISILSTVPSERIVFTYENRSLVYRFSADCIQDRKKVQNRRDAEIVRLKRRYLKLYLEEMNNASSSKRPREARPVETTPRKKFCQESPRLWKEACKAAEDLYDTDLPTLEEATLLFGFSRGISA